MDKKNNKYTQTENNEEITINEDINNEFNKIKKEYDELKQSHDSLTESYKEILNENDNTKKNLNDAINNNKLLIDKINSLNNTLKTMDTDNEKNAEALLPVNTWFGVFHNGAYTQNLFTDRECTRRCDDFAVEDDLELYALSE